MKLQEGAEMDTILIVDDSSFIVEGLISFLKKKYRPIAAYGGAECLEILKSETPAVIILDIMMEPMDGWETLSHVKENPRTRHIPVLMFSAKKISMEEAEKHRISIDDFITKPVSPGKIIEAIEKVIARRDTNRFVVGRWQAAGIAEEKIEEYLSLVTSLEVDLSLCQNMRIQYDIVPHPEKEQEEFRAIMKAVEERIRHERELIGTMAREMNLIAEQQADARPAAAQQSTPVPQDESPPSPVHEPQPLPEESPDTNTADGGNTQAIPAPAELSTQPEESPAPPPAETVPSPVPAVPAVQADVVPITSASSPSDATDGAESVQTITEPFVPTPEAGTPGVAPGPADQLPGDMERRVIPAEIDLPPETAAVSSMNGAGTDLPMPWDTSRERRPRAAMSVPEKQDTPKRPEAVQQVPGILGRILSFIRSLTGGRG